MNTKYLNKTIAGITLFFALASSSMAVRIDDVMPQLIPGVGTPMTMLNLSRDHQLSYKAYNEYTDLNGDGIPEVTYLHSYQYYGFFDSNKCYTYNTASNQFNPSALADKITNFCSGAWSGNFLNWATMTRMDVVRKILYGGYRAVDLPNETVLERAYLPTDAHAFAKFYDGTGGATVSQVTPFAVSSVTICNATISRNGGVSTTNTDRPLLRITSGNYSLWNSNERWQCYWSEEKGASNGNNSGVTGLAAASSNPSRAATGQGTGIGPGDYVVRVRACDASVTLTNDEQARCRQYSTGTRKPIGLLHTYGEGDQSEFGLITGSYSKNISGGVLRRNVTSFGSEVNFRTDGTFVSGVQGIVYNINRIRQYGYDYGDGTYIGSDGCSYQQIGIGTGGPRAVPQGNCSSWGNPIGTMFLEALRYFGGLNETVNFDTGANSKDSQLGLTKEAFSDPLKRNNVAQYGEPVCRPINVINFNASVNSYDSNNVNWSGFSQLNNAPNIDGLTNQIGNFEGLTSGLWFVGNNGAGNNNNLCTGKTIPSLANVTGICPEAPTYYGSYKLAGAALYAHTNPIRSDIPIPAGNTKAFRVNTYSVALATSSPRIEVNVNGNKVIIQPSYRLDLGGANVGAGTLVDFRIVSQTPTFGSYIVQWEDSEQGGDYDQDVWGLMEYSVNGNQITVSSQVVGAASGNGQGMGFIISGTDRGDGPHYQAGAYGLNYNDNNPPAAPNFTFTGTNLNATGGCSNCQANDGIKTATFVVTGAGNAGSPLQDPLYYAAKYGNFSGSYTGGPLNVTQWDTKKTNGTLGPDGIPDAYFYAINPAELERAIQGIFKNLVPSGGTSPATTGSRLQTNGQIFLTQYTNTTNDFGRGDVLAYSLDVFGVQGATPSWTAADQLTARTPSSRTLITNRDGIGQPFQWLNTSLTTEQKLALNIDGSGFFDGKGQERLAYLRGDRSNENTGSNFRLRRSLLGDIINSTPWFVGEPNGAYPDLLFPGFTAYLRANADREKMIYVGANDGILHALRASDGQEVMGFVPNAVFTNLSKLTDPLYSTRTFVDGALFAGDVNVNGWKTYLIGSTGRGAQSIFALDVTDPSTFTEANASSIFKWEFSDKDDADMGNVIGNPTTNPQTNLPQQIVRMNNGKWALVLGNGYRSDTASDIKGVPDSNAGSGGAVLYVLFLDGPSIDPSTQKRIWLPSTTTQVLDYVKIPLFDTTCGATTGPTLPLTDPLCAGAGPNNGLGTVTPIDIDNDGNVDYLYAADLKGNVFKVNVSGAVSSWFSSFSRLYTANTLVSTPAPPRTVIQPITTAVTAILHPFGGVMVNFITGQSFNAADLNDLTRQTLYGIWDRPVPIPSVAYPTPSDRSRLQQQGANNVISPNGLGRSGTSVGVDWNTKDGWYYDLPYSGERGIFNPYFNDSDVLVFDTLFVESNGSNCSVDTSTILNALDPITGRIPNLNIDLNNDGLFDSLDKLLVGGKLNSVSGYVVKGGVSGSSRLARPQISVGGGRSKAASFDSYKTQTDKGTIATTNINSGEFKGRIYWREILRDAQ